ncbi:MAG: twin-arginine translocase subunit TatC [Planctomycetota bacterium]|jgi:sec-independent protein translocase protein TatC
MPLDQPDIDVPLPLGAHLDELRRVLVRPIIVLVAVAIVAFAFQAELKQWMLEPLWRAIDILKASDPEVLKGVGLPLSRDDGRLLKTFTLGESATTAMKISLLAAVFITVPVIVHGLWTFISRGLTASERRAAFLFIPAGLILFYAGVVIGYCFALPYFYVFLIDFQASDPTAVFELRQADYVDTFMLWTVAFGLVCDIPWAVMILVKTGIVSIATLNKGRRYVILINLVLAACLTPTADVASLLAMFIPMQVFFEIGLLLSHFVKPRARTDA